MLRFIVAVFLGCCVGFSPGCASLGAAVAAVVGPKGTSLIYVAPFLDRTEGMELWLLLTATVQENLYARAPGRFVIVFDDAAAAVDGTVISVSDEVAGGAKRDVVVRARAVLVDKSGRVRHDTGVVDRRARYEVDSDKLTTESRRRRAVALATSTVGRALVDDILRMP